MNLENIGFVNSYYQHSYKSKAIYHVKLLHVNMGYRILPTPCPFFMQLLVQFLQEQQTLEPCQQYQDCQQNRLE